MQHSPLLLGTKKNSAQHVGWRLGVAGMALRVDAAFTEGDLEQSLVSPRVIPRVGDEPVLFTILDTPSNDLHSVASEGLSRGMLVDTGLVVREIGIHGEGSGHGTILHQILLDISGVSESVSTVSGEVLVTIVNDLVVRWAAALALGLDLLDILAVRQ